MKTEITIGKVIITMSHEEAKNMLKVASAGYQICEDRMWEAQKVNPTISQEWREGYVTGKEFFDKISVVANL